MKRKDIDIVFFDAGNTLIYPAPSFEEGIWTYLRGAGHEQEFDALKDAALAALDVALGQIADGRRYSVSDDEDALFWTDAYADMLSRLGFDGDARRVGLEVYRHWQREDAFELFPDVEETLRALADAGVRMGLLSNFGSHLEGMLKFHGVWDYFDPAIISANHGWQKPETEIFKIAVKAAKVAPGRAVIVGDNPVDDMMGGRSHGLMPVIIDRQDRLADRVDCPRILRMTDLPGLILAE